MRIVTAAALVAAQIATAAPASAAELYNPDAGTMSARQGAFAGARFRLSLNGRKESRARLGLAATPVLRNQTATGEARLRFGEGLELGFASGEKKPAARLGGRRFTADGVVDENGRRLGVSTIGGAAIVGGLIVAGLLVYALAERGDPDS